MSKSKKPSVSHRTIDLRKYLLSDRVSEDSEEFLPKQAAIDILETTGTTIKHRVESGELEEKTFFLTEPVKKTFLGVKAGGVKRLLLKKISQRLTIAQHVDDSIVAGKLTSYADTMEVASMNWKSPPDRKYCNAILEEISNISYDETIDSGHPCMKSAVVVSRNERIPTDSFFDCAASLGLLSGSESKDEKIMFWEGQRDLAFETYGNPTAHSDEKSNEE